MDVKVKICGFTNKQDALDAVACGADAIGLIFAQHSPRCITVKAAASILRAVGPYTASVGVFLDQGESTIRKAARLLRLSTIQLHGRETAKTCNNLKKEFKVIKTLFPADQDLFKAREYYKGNVDAFLLDVDFFKKQKGPFRFDWKNIYDRYRRFFVSEERIIISGGLSAANVAEAVNLFKPYAVDVAGGVESIVGKKNKRLMREFIRRAKQGS